MYPARGMVAGKDGMGDPASKLTELNCMRAGSASAAASLPDLSRLEGLGYLFFPFSQIKVLNTDQDLPGADPAWHSAHLGREGWDVLINGTFTYDLPRRYHSNPVGTVIRNGVLEAVGLDRSAQRGGIAVLSDGSVVIGRSQGTSESEIGATYGEGALTVREFMGGGVQLVEYGQPVPSHDLREVQGFTSGQGGIGATQLQQSDHAAVGIRNGQAIAVFAWAKSGRDIRADLLDIGFSSVVKFAGGSAAFLKDKKGFHAQGTNSVGFGLRVRRY